MCSRIKLSLVLILSLVASAQEPGPDRRLEKHGTCAVTVTAPFGTAFIIDSRVTSIDGAGRIVSQAPGCKVLLARPTTLLAGIGVEDTTGRAGHWNSLDAASDALKTLPDNPTVTQLDLWSNSWGDTLIKHFRQGGEMPLNMGEVANILLVTKFDGRSYYRRTSVEWNGGHFIKSVDGQTIDQLVPQVHYAGACRDFARVNDGEGHILPVKYPRTYSEQKRFDHWGDRKIAAKSVTDLADVVYGIESVITDMDARLEGKHAVIAPPYAAAEWPGGEQEWRTDFNVECKASAPLGTEHP